ncbi:MAG TPA: hypothetical protein QGH10_17875 [Armatimonadota bacterium]|jgi:uncharacterized membrane protein|nr:hypothetical protein [Armatimonadota bacterium]
MSEETPEAITEEEQTTLAPPPAPRSLWREIALGLVILLCGGVIGSCMTILFARKAVIRSAFSDEQRWEQMVPIMLRGLNLSREQDETIRPIIDEHLKETMEIRNDARVEAAQELREMEEAVAAELTPEQLGRWRKTLAGYRMGGRQGGQRGGPGEGRGGGGMGRGKQGQGGQQRRGMGGGGGRRNQPSPPPKPPQGNGY